MGRKVSTPKLVMGDFGFKIWYIAVIAILFVIIYVGFKEADTTVYKDNHMNIKYSNNVLDIKNSNEVPVDIKLLNNSYNIEITVPAKSKETLETLAGSNRIFLKCEYFEDSFTVARNTNN